MTTAPQPTREHAVKILQVLERGLCSGMGKPVPGQMCVEAAVCYAMDLPHSDEPPCVHPAVRSFKIALNDSSWSSNLARAKGLRRLAIAQLGSAEPVFKIEIFTKELALAAVRQIVPIALRAAASMSGNAGYKDTLEEHAKKCEGVTDELNAARAASDAASDAASYARAASYAARAASYAASYARAASDAASYAARAASDAASYAASDAASYAARAASDAARAASDEVLNLMAEAGVQALIKAGSPGCEWLDLAPV